MMKRARGIPFHGASGLAGLVWLWGTAPLTCLLGAALLPAGTCGAQTTVTQIAAGNQHSLFVKSDGSLWAMGFNYFGQLGDGTGSSQTNQPEMIVSNGVTTIAAAGNHSFFTTGSSLWAMGDNQSGQLGDGTTNNLYVPKPITPVIALGAGDSHTLFTRSSGFFRDLYAMGDNGLGELGNGTYNSTNQPERIEHDDTIVFGDYYVTAVAAGYYHSLFLKSDGSLWAMGDDAAGQLGDGGFLKTNRAEKIVPSGVTAIAAAGFDSLFLRSNGSLWAMGDNDYGQLGDPNVRTGNVNGFTNVPVEIEPSGVTAIAAGYYHNLFLKSDGSLWGMGYNAYGQLGDPNIGTTGNSFTNRPVQIVAGGVTAISAGSAHSLFLTSDGSLWGMGQSLAGQLGISSTANQNRPVQIIGPIVANGGFETHDFTGWTFVGSFSSVTTNSASVHSGQCGAQMGQIGSLALLSQTLNTTPGTNYLLSFWLNSDGQVPNEFTASWNGATLLDKTNLPATGWTNLQFVVAAAGPSTVLQFGFRDDPGDLGFDDVSVVPLSQPAITGIGLAGTNLVLTANDGLWNGTYLTLTSTNLAQPLSQWTPVATNTLDGSGPFTIIVTNGVNASDSKRFFTLQLR
jgi:alpha-tubulin suppressor-like RCC1 family protein